MSFFQDTQSDCGETVGHRKHRKQCLYDNINALTSGGVKKKLTGNKTGGKNPNRPTRPNQNRPKNQNRPNANRSWRLIIRGIVKYLGNKFGLS